MPEPHIFRYLLMLSILYCISFTGTVWGSVPVNISILQQQQEYLENQANYHARGYSFTIAIGTSVGESSYGSDSGSTNSTSTVGITGIVGDVTKRTGDADQAIQRIFNQQAVEAEVKAQIQITQAFIANKRLRQ